MTMHLLPGNIIPSLLLPVQCTRNQLQPWRRFWAQC